MGNYLLISSDVTAAGLRRLPQMEAVHSSRKGLCFSFVRFVKLTKFVFLCTFIKSKVTICL